MKVCSWSRGQWWIVMTVGLTCHLCPAQTPSVEAARAANTFAFKLAPALHALPENYVVCPYALHRTLSLTLEGQRERQRNNCNGCWGGRASLPQGMRRPRHWASLWGARWQAALWSLIHRNTCGSGTPPGWRVHFLKRRGRFMASPLLHSVRRTLSGRDSR